MIYLGGTEISDVYIGTERPATIYVGTDKIWPPDTDTPPAPSWDFFDDFERSTIGSAWTGSGGLINNGALRKNTTAGSADYWTAQQFSSDDLTVEAVLGPVTDAQQRASIMLGSSSQYIYFEFSLGFGVIGAYNGSTWTILQNFGGIAWTQGDVIRIERIGSTVRAYRNNVLIASGSSAVARGTAYRRVALTVKGDRVFIANFYGPTFDSVGVAAQ